MEFQALPIPNLVSPPNLDWALSDQTRAQARPKRTTKEKNARGSTLACLNCRSKKIKCLYEADGCKKCKKLGVACLDPNGDERKTPSSKSHIKELYRRIASLEEALKAAESRSTSQTPGHTSKELTGCSLVEQRPSSPQSHNRAPGNIIARLCGQQWQLNSDEEGQFRFFGPTSSLHLAESISSSIVGPWEAGLVNGKLSNEADIGHELRNYLLEIYWKYQHTVLQVFQKEAFLRDMEAGQTKFFSKALFYCVLACAARISDQPRIRALALPADNEIEDEQPFLVATATKLLEQELKRPQLTTIQALLLLSVIHCALSRNTKGWLYTGDACRLAIDFGLHRDCSQLVSANMSETDIEVRQITFWGCVVFDRLWALYLGRPYCLILDDGVTIPHPTVGQSHHSWEGRMAFAWATLLEVVGHICDALNGNHCTTERVAALDEELRAWHSRLDPSLQYTRDGPPSVAVLHMQYCSATILLQRPTANFGTGIPGSPTSYSRGVCVENATTIARFLDEYRSCHGDATTLSGVALHTIATAATTLIADIAERREVDKSHQLLCLKTCVRTLGEMELTYIVARRVRKIIQLVMRLCQLEVDRVAGHQLAASVNKTSVASYGSAEGFSPENDIGEMPAGDTGLCCIPTFGM